MKWSKIFKAVALLMVLCLGISCSNFKKEMSVGEYVDWFRENQEQFIHSKKMDGFNLNLRYAPSEWIAIKQCENTADRVAMTKSLKDQENQIHFVLEISGDEYVSFLKEGASSNEELLMRMDYFMDHAQLDMVLVQCGDTLLPSLYHLERYHDQAPDRMNIVFDQVCDKGATFIYNDQVLGLGPVKFSVNTSKEGKPSIKI